jgi:hypothetical protein
MLIEIVDAAEREWRVAASGHCSLPTIQPGRQKLAH